jgi:hypothetical protein
MVVCAIRLKEQQCPYVDIADRLQSEGRTGEDLRELPVPAPDLWREALKCGTR